MTTDVDRLAEALYLTFTDPVTEPFHGEGEQRAWLRHAQKVKAYLAAAPVADEDEIGRLLAEIERLNARNIEMEHLVAASYAAEQAWRKAAGAPNTLGPEEPPEGTAPSYIPHPPVSGDPFDDGYVADQLSGDHEPHRGNHVGYACGFSGPHCWACGEPWPCRAERGVIAADEPEGATP